MEKAERFNEGKRNWSLVDYKSLEEMVMVLEFGAEKYSADNWKKGLNRKELLESAMRHLVKLMDAEHFNEEIDAESSLHHMGHVMCNAMFYLYHQRNESFTK